MKYKIILVPFPFDDLSGIKVRPAICLTEKISGYDHVIIAFITSQIDKATEESDLLILASDPDFSQTGLKVNSAIRLHRLITIPTSIIRRQLGELPAKDRTETEKKLRKLFDL